MIRVEIALTCPECDKENHYGVDPENIPTDGVRCSASLGVDERNKAMLCPHHFTMEVLTDAVA